MQTTSIWVLAGILACITAATWIMCRTLYHDLIWDIDLAQAARLDDARERGPRVRLRVTGNIPHKMYVQDSQTISLIMTPLQQAGADIPLQQVVIVQLELLAAAFEIVPAHLQQYQTPQLGSTVTFLWNIMPKYSGYQQLTVIPSWIDSQRREYELPGKTCDIKVVQFAGLSTRQLQWLTGMAGFLTLVATVAGVLVTWFKP